ncbi:MAG TPA: CHAT domain-containing protein, partial [Pyrinomonadaceae bacterium]
ELKQRDAEQLLMLLKSADQPPAIVVLSACYSAGGAAGKMLGGHESAPLAAELVAGGIPVVVGMSGQVSDLACRLFTRRFGTALVSGEQLVKAASEGRCAAFTQGQPPQSSIDWAFPTVFMAEGVEPEYVPLPADALNTVPIVNRWIEDYKIKRPPVFCSREEFFEAYYQLFKPHEPKTLAAYTISAETGFGKTRLLQQLAITALCEGHIPCLVSSELSIWKPPQNVAQLCVEIFKAIGVARRALDLSLPFKSVLLKSLLFELDKHPSDYPDMRKKVNDIEENFKDYPLLCFDKITSLLGNLKDILKPEDMRAALQVDFNSLLVDAREKHPQTVSENGRVIVMLDEVHRYDKALAPLFYNLIEDSGLGTSSQPVPVVMALSKATVADPIINDVQESMRARVRFLPIQLFGDDEYMLVYQHVLLHPFALDLRPGTSDTPWVFNYQVEPKIVNRYREKLSSLKRRPVDFNGEVLYVIVEFARDEEFALKADDEALLDALQKKL